MNYVFNFSKSVLAMNDIFKFCQDVLTYIAHEFGITYHDTNIILFDIIGPLFIILSVYLIFNRKTKYPVLFAVLAFFSFTCCFLHFAFFVSSLPPWYFFPAIAFVSVIIFLKRTPILPPYKG